jgi:hypothetical protein
VRTAIEVLVFEPTVKARGKTALSRARRAKLLRARLVVCDGIG